MSKRYYRHNSSLFNLTRNERMFFKFSFKFIKILILTSITTVKELYKLTKYIRKIIINYYSLKNIGYNLNEIFDMIYSLSPRQFEVFCAELFKQHGYRVKLTAETNDYGRDIILNDNIFVEYKHYRKENMVGREICQKLLGSCQMFSAAKGIIITTGTFHRNAYECASMVNNLELLGFTDIQQMLLDLKPEQISKIMIRTKNAA